VTFEADIRDTSNLIIIIAIDDLSCSWFQRRRNRTRGELRGIIVMPVVEKRNMENRMDPRHASWEREPINLRIDNLSDLKGANITSTKFAGRNTSKMEVSCGQANLVTHTKDEVAAVTIGLFFLVSLGSLGMMDNETVDCLELGSIISIRRRLRKSDGIRGVRTITIVGFEWRGAGSRMTCIIVGELGNR
jgi:hypothetical protein